MFRFNVYGAAKGKLGPAGAAGVLRNNRGEVLCMFSKSLGVRDSNEAKVLAILEAMHIFLSLFNGGSLWRVIRQIQFHGFRTTFRGLGSFSLSVMISSY